MKTSASSSPDYSKNVRAIKSFSTWSCSPIAPFCVIAVLFAEENAVSLSEGQDRRFERLRFVPPLLHVHSSVGSGQHAVPAIAFLPTRAHSTSGYNQLSLAHHPMSCMSITLDTLFIKLYILHTHDLAYKYITPNYEARSRLANKVDHIGPSSRSASISKGF